MWPVATAPGAEAGQSPPRVLSRFRNDQSAVNGMSLSSGRTISNKTGNLRTTHHTVLAERPLMLAAMEDMARSQPSCWWTLLTIARMRALLAQLSKDLAFNATCTATGNAPNGIGRYHASFH